MRRFLAILAAVVLLPAIASADLRLQTTDPNLIEQYNDRFSTAGNKAFIGEGYDWSGVGKDLANGRWATMISPSYFLTAAHYAPSSGDTLTFYIGNDTSNPKTATISSTWYNVPGTDLELGMLTQPLPTGVTYYPVGQGGATFPGRQSYLNQTIFVYGQPNLVGENVISSVKNYTFDLGNGNSLTEYSSSFDFHITGGMGEADCQLQSGDSGGPSFIVENGRLVLEGIHYAIGTNVSYDTFVPYYVTALDSNMVGEQVTVAPEPASALFLLLGGPLLLIRRRSAVRRRAH